MRWLVLPVVVVGCAGSAAEGPLTVKLNIPRDQAVSQLRGHSFCRKQGEPPARTETYPRCDRPGTEWGESWVIARYEKEQLVELKRYERFTDENRAVERWNQLIADRAKQSPGAADVTATLKGRLLEPGTKSMKAFRVDASTVVGVYLLTPTPPEDASVLETVVLVPDAGER